MENFRMIELQRKRDFSSKMNATFEFIKQNFKSLSKSILYIAGPPVLVGSLLIGSFVGQLLGATQTAAADPTAFQNMFTSSGFFVKLILMFTFLMLSGVITLATINNYILLYSEKRTNQIEVSEVWERVRASFWMYFRTLIFFVLLIIVIYVLMIIPISLLAVTSPGLIFFGVFILFFASFYFLISMSLIFVIRTNENLGFFESLTRSFKLVLGKWWSTFGLIMILYFIMGIISYIPLIPFYAVIFTRSLHDVNSNPFASPSTSWEIWTTLFFTVYYLLQMLLNTLPNVGIAFQYYNLVELKEAKGLMQDLETIGKPQKPNRPEENF